VPGPGLSERGKGGQKSTLTVPKRKSSFGQSGGEADTLELGTGSCYRERGERELNRAPCGRKFARKEEETGRENVTGSKEGNKLRSV